MLRPSSQGVTLLLQYQSRILGSRTAVSVAITKHVTGSECGQTETKTNSESPNGQIVCLLTFFLLLLLLTAFHQDSTIMAEAITMIQMRKNSINYQVLC